MGQRASRWPKLWLCSFQPPVCPVYGHCPVSLLCPLSYALLMSSVQLCATHTQASHPGLPHTHGLQQLSSNLSWTLFTCRPNWAQTYFDRTYFWAHMLVVRPQLFSSLAGCLWHWSSCSADLTFCLFTSDQFPHLWPAQCSSHCSDLSSIFGRVVETSSWHRLICQKVRATHW